MKTSQKRGKIQEVEQQKQDERQERQNKEETSKVKPSIYDNMTTVCEL